MIGANRDVGTSLEGRLLPTRRARRLIARLARCFTLEPRMLQILACLSLSKRATNKDARTFVRACRSR